MEMLSNKPYLIRAFYEWIVDSQCTPFVTVNANDSRCKIPQQFVEDGQITLNVSPMAVREFKVSSDLLEFVASFSGVVYRISAPVSAVLAIYAQENGEGMFFDYEEELDSASSNLTWEGQGERPAAASSNESTTSSKRPSHLTLVE